MPFYTQFGYIPQQVEPVSKCIPFQVKNKKINNYLLKLLTSGFIKSISALQPNTLAEQSWVYLFITIREDTYHGELCGVLTGRY